MTTTCTCAPSSPASATAPNWHGCTARPQRTDADLSRAVLALNLVDRIVVTTPRTNPNGALQALIDRTVLSGFTVVSITAAGDELVVQTARRTGTGDIQP